MSNSSLSSLEWRQTAMATFSNGISQIGRLIGRCGTSHQGKLERFGGAFFITSSTSADWCGYHIELWNGMPYTRWRAAWWRLEGPNPKFGYYGPA